MKILTLEEKQNLTAENFKVEDQILDQENGLTLIKYENVEGYFYTISSGTKFWISEEDVYDENYLELGEIVY